MNLISDAILKESKIISLENAILSRPRWQLGYGIHVWTDQDQEPLNTIPAILCKLV